MGDVLWSRGSSPRTWRRGWWGSCRVLGFGQCGLGIALSSGGEFVGSTFRFPDILLEFLLSALLLELILSSGW